MILYKINLKIKVLFLHMVYIYILELNNKKYYVGKTNDPKFRINTHFNASGCSWTKKYKPKQMTALYPDCDDFDEDKYTLKYMKKYVIIYRVRYVKIMR